MENTKKILLVEDFEPLLEEVSEFLTMEGYTVYTATDGTIGVQKAIQYLPDLIICDIEMPNMDGYEVFQAIEQIPKTKGTPFIFATARAQSEDFRKGLQLGVDDYITKPYEINELVLSIQKRFDKIEHIKRTAIAQIQVLSENPLVGILYYVEGSFTYMNAKAEEITGYSLPELNKVDLNKTIASKASQQIGLICLCYQGVHNTVHLRFPIYHASKQLKYLEFFAKYIQIDGKQALVVSVLEESENSTQTSSSIEQVIEHLVASSKEELAEEIKKTSKLLSFQEKAKQEYVQEHIHLSGREKEVLELICKGYTTKEIGEKLFISKRTAENHRANILQKTGTKNTATLVAYAIKNALVVDI